MWLPIALVPLRMPPFGPKCSPLTTEVVGIESTFDPIELTEGVVAADLFLHARLGVIADLRSDAAKQSGAKGIARLRRVFDLAEPEAASPMETRLRMILMLAGLPRPEVQGSIHDDQGHPLGRPDLLYRVQRLAIEFDGGNHRERLVDENVRQRGLVRAWHAGPTAATIANGWSMTIAARTA